MSKKTKLDRMIKFVTQQESPEPRTAYKRIGDMSPDDYIEVFFEDDGDVIVTVYQYIDDTGRENYRSASVQFCTCGSGGGRSPEVRQALRQLALAIIADNEQGEIT